MWREIDSRSARRFAKRVSRERETPCITIFNNREVLVYMDRAWAKGEEVGSYTATKKQLADRPLTTRSYVRGRNMYAPVDVALKKE
jgi:hypothetical protein